MNIDIIKDILKNHCINSAILVDEGAAYNIVICSMTDDLSFDRWTNLENLLKYCTKKDIHLSSYPQVKKHLKDEYIKKGVIINA